MHTAHLYFEATQYASAKHDVIMLATDIMNVVELCVVPNWDCRKVPIAIES